MSKEATKKAIKYTYEFNYTFKINGVEQVSRDFNVRDYNDKFRESLESHDLLVDIMGDGSSKWNGVVGMIPSVIKNESVQRLWKSLEYDKFNEQPIKTKNTTFSFEIKKRVGDNKETILQTEYENNFFQPSLFKYKLDIREVLPEVMETIKTAMSMDNYTTTYSGEQIKRYNKIHKKELNNILNERK